MFKVNVQIVEQKKIIPGFSIANLCVSQSVTNNLTTSFILGFGFYRNNIEMISLTKIKNIPKVEKALKIGWC